MIIIIWGSWLFDFFFLRKTVIQVNLVHEHVCDFYLFSIYKKMILKKIML